MPDKEELKQVEELPDDAREMSIYGYYKWPNLWVFVCPNCGSTGPRGSECQHDAPIAGGDGQIPRESIHVNPAPTDE